MEHCLLRPGVGWGVAMLPKFFSQEKKVPQFSVGCQGGNSPHFSICPIFALFGVRFNQFWNVIKFQNLAKTSFCLIFQLFSYFLSLCIHFLAAGLRIKYVLVWPRLANWFTICSFLFWLTFAVPNSIWLAFALGQLDSARIRKILIRTHP